MHIWLLVKDPHLASLPAIKKHLIWWNHLSLCLGPGKSKGSFQRLIGWEDHWHHKRWKINLGQPCRFFGAKFCLRVARCEKLYLLFLGRCEHLRQTSSQCRETESWSWGLWIPLKNMDNLEKTHLWLGRKIGNWKSLCIHTSSVLHSFSKLTIRIQSSFMESH